MFGNRINKVKRSGGHLSDRRVAAIVNELKAGVFEGK